MFINHKLLSLLAVLFIFSACSKPSDDTSILINIEKEFTVSMIETLSQDANPLNLQIATINELECSNYEIISSYSVSDERVVASIDFLREPEDCIEETSIISSAIKIGNLENGRYIFRLNLELGSIVNEGTLTIDDEKYTIELDSEYGIKFPIKRLYKIPDNYIWGKINIAANAPGNLLDEFTAELGHIVDVSTLPTGEYGHFKINADLDVDFTSNELQLSGFSSVDSSSFIFKLTGTKADLEEILDSYRNTFNDQIDIYMVTSEGETL